MLIYEHQQNNKYRGLPGLFISGSYSFMEEMRKPRRALFCQRGWCVRIYLPTIIVTYNSNNKPLACWQLIEKNVEIEYFVSSKPL
jgi:hypothetical protein